MVDLIKSQKWRNWKRKGKEVKDLKGQALFNEGMMATMENQHDILMDHHKTLIRQAELIEKGSKDLYLVVIPLLEAMTKSELLMDIFKANMSDEDFNRIFKKIAKEPEKKETEAGETMDA